MSEPLGARIKRFRQERDLTLQAVADELGLTPAAISHWESGRIVPKQKKLADLAKALRVSVLELDEAPGSPEPTARELMAEVDEIIREAEERIAAAMGRSSNQVRLSVSYERR